MKDKNIIKILLVLMLGVIFFSCDEGGDPNPGETTLVDMAGDWYVQLFVDGEDISGYVLLSTYNTSANNGNEMWIDDHDHDLMHVKVKVPVNTSSKTFAGSDLVSEYSFTEELEDETEVEVFPIVTITNGQIIAGGATTTGGNPSDSISFTMEFSDDPGTIYTVSGYKRTGFLEDEH